MCLKSLRNSDPNSTKYVLACFFNVLVIIAAFLLRLFLLPFESGDLHSFIYPWLNYIRSHGGISALRDSFYDYNPPYIYVLTLLSYLPSSIPDVALVKLPSICIDFVAAFTVAKLVQVCTSSQLKSRLAFGLVLFSPTLVLNSSLWGQCDVIYSSFLLMTVLMVLGNRPKIACLCFGCALSFKLQAIFLGPYMLWAWIMGLITFWNLLWVPVVFFVALLPALLMGRSMESLLSIYINQSNTYRSLSMNAPNLYHWIPDQHYELFVPAGFMLTLVFVIISSWLILEKKGSASSRAALLFAFASTLAMPFFLPKMHERYFFSAELFSIPLIMSRPRWAPLFGLLQLVSLSTYFRYLFGKPILDFGDDSLLLCGIVFFTLAQFVKEPHGSVDSVLPRIGLPSLSNLFTLSCYSFFCVSTFLYLSTLTINSSFTNTNPRITIASLQGPVLGQGIVPAFDIRQDWGQAKEGRNIDENTLRVGGKVFSQGFGVHANSSMKFQLAGKYKTFEGKVGIPDYLSSTEPTSIRFMVKGDDIIRWSSLTLHPGARVQSFQIPVEGVQTLELVVDDTGNGNTADHGAWVDLIVVPVLD